MFFIKVSPKEVKKETLVQLERIRQHFNDLTERIFELQLVAGDLNSYGSESIGFKALRSPEDF